MSSGIKVFAPATVSNIAIGFDVLGFALDAPGDEIIIKLSDKPGLRIAQITGAGGKLPYDIEKNTAGLAAKKLLEHLGEAQRGIHLEIHKKMPFGSGIGSSAASAVGAVFGINEILKTQLSKRELIPFALEGEALASGTRHADNVAPCMLGGMVLVRHHDNVDIHRLVLPKGLYATVVHPHGEVLTKAARAILQPDVSLKDAVQQTANMGAFIVGLYNSDFDLISRSLNDRLIEPQRAQLIPHFYEVKEAALRAGALGCSISGSGPAIFALSANSLIAEEVGEAFQRVYKKYKIENDLFLSGINQEGAVKC